MCSNPLTFARIVLTENSVNDDINFLLAKLIFSWTIVSIGFKRLNTANFFFKLICLGNVLRNIASLEKNP